MLDSGHSPVTYTSISSDDGSLDVGSLGVIVYGYDGLPMMPEDPYTYVEAAMQEPPPPDYVPEPAYLEFMPPEDDVFLAEEQPLPAAVSPTAERTPIPFPSEAEVDRILAIPTPPPSPLTLLSSLLPQIPLPPQPVSSPLPISPPPLPISPTHLLSYRAAMIRLRAKSPSTSHLLLLPPPIVLLHTKASMAMMRAVVPSAYCLAPPSLLPIPLPTSSPPLLLPSTDCRADVLKVMLPPQKRLCIAPGPRYEIEESSSTPTARSTGGFRADYDFFTTLDAKIRCDMDKEIGVVDALAEHEIQRNNSLNGDGSQGSRSGITRPVCPTRKCTYTDILKCQPMNFKGTERVVGLTQWFERMETIFNISNCAVEKQELALLCGRMFPEESNKIEKYVGGLPDMIHGSVMASKPKTMQDAIKFATELVDKKICTFVKHQTENKRKFEDTSRNNQNQQQQNKRQNTGRAYIAGPSERNGVWWISSKMFQVQLPL
ncbi:hypothetical protein Tco_1349071 [Tanacetum coccineum]